ncbi:MAG: hypothetical protein IPL23_10645 [Saprospiraceae bacterium]|nr:hypothetical protein [Saprospiraceae bacterium]
MYNSVHCRLDTYLDRLIDGSFGAACPETNWLMKRQKTKKYFITYYCLFELLNVVVKVSG